MNTKRCKTCHKEKPLTEFYHDRQYYRAECKECYNITRAGKTSLERNKRREENYKYLLNHPCEICGINNPLLLEYHHIKKGSKKLELSNLINKYCQATVKQERKKCRVLCANCHRLLTNEENQTWKWKYQQNLKGV